ncbi:MAG: hypothetical protein WDO13_06880 [Verrucomicrobiota bacterium]
MKRKTRAYMQVGDLRIQRINVSEREWRDFYHWVLSLRWSRFSFLVLGVYLAVNLAFAGLYVAGAGQHRRDEAGLLLRRLLLQR